MLDHFLYACIGNRFAVSTLVARSEEILQTEDSVRSLDVLISDSPADCSFMNTNIIGYLSHRAGSEFGYAFVEELALDFHDFLGDAFDGLLTLFDRADEEFA